jgi:NarL family two-component system response regulator LiaR
VLVVDDHPIVRRGLRSFIETFDEFELIGDASDGNEAIRLAVASQPDVVLMDLVMPGMDGATATRDITARCPGTRVIVLTSFAEEDLVPRALHAGAISYLFKGVEIEELAAAIRSAAAGRATIAVEALRVMLRQAHRDPSPFSDLSPREHDVLSLMLEGLGNADIAERLIIGRATVKFHVSSILAKLGVRTRTEAVALALQQRRAA